MFKKSNEAEYWKEQCRYLSLKLAEKERENQILSNKMEQFSSSEFSRCDIIKKMDAIINGLNRRVPPELENKVDLLRNIAKKTRKSLQQMWKMDNE